MPQEATLEKTKRPKKSYWRSSIPQFLDTITLHLELVFEVDLYGPRLSLSDYTQHFIKYKAPYSCHQVLGKVEYGEV